MAEHILLTAVAYLVDPVAAAEINGLMADQEHKVPGLVEQLATDFPVGEVVKHGLVLAVVVLAELVVVLADCCDIKTHAKETYQVATAQ